MKLKVNGKEHEVAAPGDMPLLWVLRDMLGPDRARSSAAASPSAARARCTSTASPARSCVLPAVGRARPRGRRRSKDSPPTGLHAVQRAWIEEDVVQCGYCQPGQIMAATALLASPAAADGRRHRRGHVRQHLPLRDLPAHPGRGHSAAAAAGAGRRSHERAPWARPPPVPEDLRRPRDRLLRRVRAARAASAFAQEAAAAAAKPLPDPNAFLRIGEDESVTVLLAHSEMGQGDLDDAADARRGGARMRLVEDAGRARARRSRLRAHGLRHADDRRLDVDLHGVRPLPAGRRARPRDARRGRGASSGRSTRPSCRVEKGFVVRGDKRLSFGKLATAAQKLTPPEQVRLKDREGLDDPRQADEASRLARESHRPRRSSAWT